MIQKKVLVRGQEVSNNGTASSLGAPSLNFERHHFRERKESSSSSQTLGSRRPILNLLGRRAFNTTEEDIRMARFLDAIRRNDVEEVRRTIAEGVDPNLPNYNGNGEIPIIEATYSGSVDVIRYLLDNRVNVNMRNLMGESAVHIAAQPNYFNPEILRLYLNHPDTDVNVQDRTSGRTLLHILSRNCVFDKHPERIRAQSFELIRHLLPLCNANKRDFRGESALHVCVDGNLENVALMEEQISGAVDMNIRNDKGETALICAINKGFMSFTAALVHAGTNLNLSDLNRQTPLHRATQKNYVEVVGLLLEYGCDVNLADQLGDTALHIAAGRGFLEIVKLLLSIPGVETKKLNHHKSTPYQCALDSGFPQVVHTILVTKYLPASRDKIPESAQEDPDDDEFTKDGDDRSSVSLSSENDLSSCSMYSPPCLTLQNNKYARKVCVGAAGDQMS